MEYISANRPIEIILAKAADRPHIVTHPSQHGVIRQLNLLDEGSAAVHQPDKPCLPTFQERTTSDLIRSARSVLLACFALPRCFGSPMARDKPGKHQQFVLKPKPKTPKP